MVCVAVPVGKVGMLEPTIYGLTGLAAMLVVAFYFACADDFAPDREKSSLGRRKNAYFHDCQMIETETGNLQFHRTVGKQQESTPAHLRTMSPVETAAAAIYSKRCQSDRRHGEAFHG
jgi:hypothetical protein